MIVPHLAASNRTVIHITKINWHIHTFPRNFPFWYLFLDLGSVTIAGTSWTRISGFLDILVASWLYLIENKGLFNRHLMLYFQPKWSVLGSSWQVFQISVKIGGIYNGPYDWLSDCITCSDWSILCYVRKRHQAGMFYTSNWRRQPWIHAATVKHYKVKIKIYGFNFTLNISF